MANQQNPHAVSELVHALEQSQGKANGRKGFSCKKTRFQVAGSDDISVDSWRFQDWDYKKPDLPTYARGLFTTKKKDGTPEIVTRGYDKFFNVGEVKSTEWSDVQKYTTGPYELSVKENGCIIFLSGLEDGTLLVCSKHSTGSRSDVSLSHAQAGERWAEKHLASVGKTSRDLALELRRLNATAVAELCDDDFEEHVLEYPPETAGLYLHGINFNLPEFATLSGPEVHQFADTWGFKKAQYVIIQNLDEVKAFLDKCAETGSWDGRDTEGFVIRCKRRMYDTSRTERIEDWFFKYKFEEPYLMYRSWREATKAVIAGKSPKIKKHKQITEQYLHYAKRQLAGNSNLGKEYNQNHGIIAMREGFLREIGRNGSDIIAQEIARGDDSATEGIEKDVVLVPIASIGCGKTTVALALVRLFGWGHVQNDNIEGKGNRPKRFAQGVLNEMIQKGVVIADRNNHQKRERKQIIDDVQDVSPNARLIALQYVHEPKSTLLPEIRKVTRRRVLDRGDNHQTIRAGSKGQDEIVQIMEGFLHRFEAVDTDHDPDARFDEVINLDISADSLENLETVVTKLYQMYPKLFKGDMPTHDDLANAVDWAMKNYMVDTKHDLNFNQNNSRDNKRNKVQANGRKDTQSEELAPHQLTKKLEYFSVPLSTTVINSTLGGMFSMGGEEARMFNMLKQSKRIQTEFHVTLIHRAMNTSHPDIWSRYHNRYLDTLQQRGTADKTPSLGGARVRLERVIWDERVMAIVVRLLPPEHQQEIGMLSSANEIPHVTVGTADYNIKPKESNDLLKRWMNGDQSGGQIWEKEVPGMKILDGTVRPVLQRK